MLTVGPEIHKGILQDLGEDTISKTQEERPKWFILEFRNSVLTGSHDSFGECTFGKWYEPDQKGKAWIDYFHNLELLETSGKQCLEFTNEPKPEWNFFDGIRLTESEDRDQFDAIAEFSLGVKSR